MVDWCKAWSCLFAMILGGGCLSSTAGDEPAEDDDKLLTSANEDTFSWEQNDSLLALYQEAVVVGSSPPRCEAPADGICAERCMGDVDCASILATGSPTPFSQRFPIVLLHGFNAGPESFYEIKSVLRAHGYVVEEVELSPYAPTARRTDELAAQLRDVVAKHGAARVHLIGHSLGGIDARRLASRPGFAGRLASITTVATPHLGTPIADLLEGRWVLDYAPAFMSRTAYIGQRSAGFVAHDDFAGQVAEMTESAMMEFNRQFKLPASVYGQSYAGYSTTLGIKNPNHAMACDGRYYRGTPAYDAIQPILGLAHMLVVGADDGLVSVESAKWANFRGCLPADHLDLIGQYRRTGGNRAGFEHRAFYLELVGELVACEAFAHGSAAFSPNQFSACMTMVGEAT